MGAPLVTYVRHAMAVQAEGVHPTSWELDDVGRRSANELARRLDLVVPIGALVSSTEPKALGTAQEVGAACGAEVVPEPRLREVVRPWIGPGYRALVHRYLRGEALEGWESHADVAARTAAAVDAARSLAGDGAVVVVSHGLALAVHLGSRLGPEFDREQFWSYLAFPDAWTLDHDGMLHRAPARAEVS